MSKVINSLAGKVKTVFLDSVKKSYFNLRKGFASKYTYVDHNLSRNGESVVSEYRNAANGTSTIFSSYELANAIIVTADEVKKLNLVKKWSDIYDQDIVNANTVALEVGKRSLLPMEINVLGALVTKSSEYDGYNVKISRGLNGYSTIRRFLNDKNSETKYYNYAEFLAGITEMGKEFKFNKVENSWFKKGFLGEQGNLNSTKLFVTVKW